MKAEGNAFLGNWPIAVSIDKNCSIDLSRSLFFENKNAMAISSQANRVNLQFNSFIRTPVGIKLSSMPPVLQINGNLFFECAIGLNASSKLLGKNLGRNAIWKSKIQTNGRPLAGGDLVRTEPKFEGPESYDFRVKPGQSQLTVGTGEDSREIGAFQQSDIVGPYTQQLIRTLTVATGEEDLAELWGLE
jgi:hypothetical protein